MALSNITIPSFTSLIPVDTRTNNLKVLLLPTVSTNPGQFIMFKDYYGTASNSTFTISTTGTDYLDDINNRYTFSNAFGSMSFVSDGVRSWRTIGLYNGGLTPSAGLSVFNFSDFAGLSNNFTFAGTAAISGSRLLVTSNVGSSAGSVYYNQKVNIQSFTLVAEIRFELTNGDGGTFVIQNASSNARGGLGGGLGYSGIGTSVAIRFDTYSGSTGQLSTDVLSNGSIPTEVGASGILNTALGLTAGQTWTLRLNATYSGTSLSYTITNTANNSNYTSNATINIPTIVGANTAWIGFTGGTGGATEIQYTTLWNFGN